jgi:hypothetical protein
MFHRSFDLRLFFLLFLGFIVFTVLGTLTHEIGHYTAARVQGYNATIHYGYADCSMNHDDWRFMTVTWTRYRNEMRAHLPYPGKERFESIVRKSEKANFLITLGGPLQTMLTGTIGLFLMLVFRRRFFSSEKLSLWLWMILFLSLFWLRQPFNFIMALAFFPIFGRIGSMGDESVLAGMLHLPFWLLSLITAIIGIIVLIVVVFRFVPLKQRLTFISAGLAGGLTGFVLWLEIFGKMMLP